MPRGRCMWEYLLPSSLVFLTVCFILFRDYHFSISPSISRLMVNWDTNPTKLESGTIVVTGCLGTIGVPLSLSLLKRGVHVICFDRAPVTQPYATNSFHVKPQLPPATHPTQQEQDSAAHLFSHPKFEYLFGDVRNYSSVLSIFNRQVHHNHGDDSIPTKPLSHLRGVIHLATINEVPSRITQRILHH